VLVALLLALVVAAGCVGYLAASGKSLALLRAVTTRAGRLFAGQRTEQLALDVRVIPSDGRLAGHATLTMRSLEDGRRRFYFLLNDALALRAVTVIDPDGTARPIRAYHWALLTVVDLDEPVAKDATVRLAFDYDGQPATRRISAASSILTPQQVLLNVDAFWYPADVQGFFSADVTVTVPNGMTVVHNAPQATYAQRGSEHQIHWTSERPVAGVSLIAGTYDLTTSTSEGISYQLYLPHDVHLDAQRVLTLMSHAHHTLDDRFGPSGFRTVTMFVSRDLRRGFNDGSGLMGLSIRYFRVGDYGMATIAHEIAHNWWGGTVAEKWLSPGTGGEWIVEGFAEFSSLVAIEADYGAEALTRRLTTEFFDPAHQAVIADMSVLDNALAETTARDTTYRKGAYVAMMLRRTLGDEVYFRALQEFLERFRYQQATDHDLQQVLQEVSGRKLDQFFSDWVRSDHLADLSLDGGNQAEMTVNNLGTAAIPGDIDLWTFKKSGGEPARSTVHVGDHVVLDPDVDYAVLDPQLTWADVQRQNNRYPRRSDPVYVAAANTGTIAVTRGAPVPWVRTAVSSIDSSGHAQHLWDFSRGVAEPPAWTPDGTQLIVSYSEAESLLPAIVTLATDGPQRTVGHGNSPAAAADGAIYAAKMDRIVRFAADGRESAVVQRCGALLEQPLPAPDGARLVYTAARGNHVELRVVGRDGREDRPLLAWDRDRIIYRWAPDGSRLYAVVGGDWDWQVWDIPLANEGVRVLARDAADIRDLAVSPDGTQLAFTAAPALDYPVNRHQLYIVDLSTRAARSIDVPTFDLGALAWSSTDQLLVVGTLVTPDQPFMLPPVRTLKRVRTSDGSVEEVQ